MTRQRLAIPFLVLTLTLVSGILLRAGGPAEPATPGSKAATIERGKYLVNFGSCNDCHTPWKLGPKGPEPDMTRALTGHPAEMKVSPSPTLEGSWGIAAANTMTAWTGSWGVSFTANLTPDPETGLGKWTQSTFTQTIRTGRHMGRGRKVLPPMPIPMYKNFSDADLEAIFSYLQTVPAITNKVPEPLPPAEVAGK